MTDRLRAIVSTVLELVGLLAIVVGLAEVAVWAGFVAGGAVLVLVAYQLDDSAPSVELDDELP